MGSEFTAGSVLVELKANAADLQKKLQQAKTDVADFGKGVEQAGKRIDVSGKQIGGAFDSFAAKSSTADTKIAKMVSRMVGLQLAIAQVSSSKGGLGDFGLALEAVGRGAQAAASAFYAFQGKISVGGAVILGSGVAAITFYTEKLKAAIDATNAATAASIKARLSMTQLSDAMADAAKSSSTFGNTGLQDAESRLQTMRTIFDANLKRLREIPEEIAAIRQQLDAELGTGWHIGGFDAAFGLLQSPEKKAAFKAQIEGLRSEQENRLRTNRDITGEAGGAAGELGLQKIREAAQAAGEALTRMQDLGARAIEVGLSTPAEVAAANLEAAKKNLQQVLENEIKLKAIVANDFTDPTVLAEARSQLGSLDVSAARNRFLTAQSQDAAARELNSLATGFSDAIGRGLSDAILNARSPMEALAGVGRNLFESFITDAMKQFQVGLSDAFKAVAGGSAIAGGALTAALGIGGAVLSRLGSSSESTFGNIHSAITSSEAVRGVIAGPANVALASVGENLQRAMVPVTSRLDILVTLTLSMEKSLRGMRGPGGGGGGGGQFPGVASDLA
jgi:hypothetical protein